MNFLSRILLLFVVFTLFSQAAHAIRISEVKLSKDRVDVGESFTVTAELSGDTSNYYAEFYVSEHKYATKNIALDADEVEAKFDLDTDEMQEKHINCGEQPVSVLLYTTTTKTLVENESAIVQIGSIPYLTFTPATPTPGKDVRVKLTDEDGDILPSVNVEIRDIYGGDPVSVRSKSDGTFQFVPKIAGEYRMTFENRDVCGSQSFFIKRPMIVDGPRPEKPVVGEMITAAVPAGAAIGVKVLSEDGQLYKAVASRYDGGTNFTIQDPGKYTVVFGDISTKYWSINRTINVADKFMPQIEIAPDNPVMGKPVTITVTSGGQPLSDALVIIRKPDGVENQYTTSSFGTLTYEQVTSAGIYEVKATKERHDTQKESFEAKNAFALSQNPQFPTVKDTITLAISDQDGTPVSDALANIQEINQKKVTDIGGKVSFTLQKAQKHSIRITKDLFWDKEITIIPYGTLKVADCVNEIDIGQEVSFNVFDTFNEPIEAEINIKDPFGVVSQSIGRSKTLKPEKPGNYTIIISKTNYASSNKSFYVNPYDIDVTASMGQGQLTINVTKDGNALENILVLLEKESEKKNETTDNMGITKFTVSSEGNATVVVNLDRDNYLYEEKKVNVSIVRSYELWLLATPLVIISIITLMALIVIYLGRNYFEGKSFSTPEKSSKQASTARKSTLMSEKKGRTRLSEL